MSFSVGKVFLLVKHTRRAKAARADAGFVLSPQQHAAIDV